MMGRLVWKGGIDDNFDGPERDVSVVQLRQKGLVAASWVGGRRRATRKEVELGGREGMQMAGEGSSTAENAEEGKGR